MMQFSPFLTLLSVGAQAQSLEALRAAGELRVPSVHEFRQTAPAAASSANPWRNESDGGGIFGEPPFRVDAAAFIITDADSMGIVKWAKHSFASGLLSVYAEYTIYDESAHEETPVPHPCSRLPRHAQDECYVEYGRMPMRKGFQTPLIEALRRYSAVDLYVFDHTNDYYRYLDDLSPDLRRKIRLVYNSGCRNARDAGQWLARDVGAYVGHAGTSISPLFFYFFKSFWMRGDPLSVAVSRANERTARWIRDRHLGNTVVMAAIEGYPEGILHPEGQLAERLEDAVNDTKATAFGEISLTLSSRPPKRP